MRFSTADLPPPAVWAALDEEFGAALADGKVRTFGMTAEMRVTASAVELRGNRLARMMFGRRVRRALSSVPWSADLGPDELTG